MTTERNAGGLNQSGMATNTAAFGVWWNTQITALSKASGSTLKLLRLPGESTAKTPGAYLKPSMYWSVSSRTRHAPEAALLVDFLANSDAAAGILLTERGVPGNTKLREAITGRLSATDQAAVAYLNAVRHGPAPRLTPKGASNDEAILKRHTEDVLFERTTPDRAAAAFIKELQAEIDAA